MNWMLLTRGVAASGTRPPENGNEAIEWRNNEVDVDAFDGVRVWRLRFRELGRLDKNLDARVWVLDCWRRRHVPDCIASKVSVVITIEFTVFVFSENGKELDARCLAINVE